MANAYSLTSNLKLLKGMSETQSLPVHVGIGQVLEALAYVNLVDFLGTAVYSEAVNSDILNQILMMVLRFTNQC